MRIMMIPLASAALLVVGCDGMSGMGGMGGPETSAADAAAPNPTDAAGYVANAGSSDLYEIQSSEMLRSKGSSAELKNFAQMMIDHHTKTTQQVTAAAQAAGMTPPPPALLPPHQAMLDQLRPLSGTALDTAYADQQAKAHQMALALHENYASNGDTAELRTAAQGAVPIIQQHIQRLQAIR